MVNPESGRLGKLDLLFLEDSPVKPPTNHHHEESNRLHEGLELGSKLDNDRISHC